MTQTPIYYYNIFSSSSWILALTGFPSKQFTINSVLFSILVFFSITSFLEALDCAAYLFVPCLLQSLYSWKAPPLNQTFFHSFYGFPYFCSDIYFRGYLLFLQPSNERKKKKTTPLDPEARIMFHFIFCINWDWRL